jgi:RNA polymerase sigma factor (sigma-70 family)
VRQQSCKRQGEAREGVGASQTVDDVLPAIYAQLRARLGRVLYRHRIPPEDAEDLVQTTLLLAVAQWNKIRNPEAWLLGTLHKRCILYWRARMPERERTRQLDDLDLNRGVAPDQHRRDWLADLAKVWHHLSPTHRRLLTLRYDQGLTSKEAADATGLAFGSVRKTTLRAVERLRGALTLAPPPRSGGRGQPATAEVGLVPRQPAAAFAMAAQLRGAGGAAAAWIAAVDVFVSLKPLHLRGNLARDLAAAGLGLGPPPLAEMGAGDLERYRLSVSDRAPWVRAHMLYSLRSFLLWAGERGEHALPADSVCEALRVGQTIRLPAAPRAEAAAEWVASADAFLASSWLAASTRRLYRQHLMAAGATLGRRPLAELSESDLLAFRAALLADGRAAGTHLSVLTAVRCFLAWTAEQGGHAIDLDVIRVALRGWRWQQELSASRFFSSESRCRAGEQEPVT